MVIVQALLQALASAFDMLWEVLWPLALGFILSAVIQSLVSRSAVARTLGSDSPRSLGLATLFGAASSSCSYAAVAIARSLFLKGASFPAAMVFEFASTNLVFELGLILLILLGWPFLGAEFAGGVLMIVILALLFRWTLRPQLIEEARRQAQRGLRGRMEGHAAMDMSVPDGPFWRRLLSGRGLTAVSHNFWMDVTSVWTDIGLGPLISLLSFVCSVGNVPLAAVLWNGGISFGGVIAFIFADLIIIPIVNIYRKYYGGRVALYLLGVSYAAMALAGLLIGLLFKLLGIVPAHRAVIALQTGPTLNYTSVLNVIFLGVMALLGWRFLRTGGLEMLRMMEGASVSSTDEAASQHHEHQ